MSEKLGENVYGMPAGLQPNNIVQVFEEHVAGPQFQALLPPTASRVLDFGCCTGDFTKLLAEHYSTATVIGTDCSPQFFPRQEVPIRSPRFMSWDGWSPLSETFDLITANMALHKVNSLQFDSVVSHLTRSLAPSGWLVFSVPHPIKSGESSFGYGQTGTYTHVDSLRGATFTLTHRRITDWLDPFAERLPQHEYLVNEPWLGGRGKDFKYLWVGRFQVAFVPRGIDKTEIFDRLLSAREAQASIPGVIA